MALAIIGSVGLYVLSLNYLLNYKSDMEDISKMNVEEFDDEDDDIIIEEMEEGK